MRTLGRLPVLGAALLAAACGGAEKAASPPAGSGTVLAAGELELPAAEAFGESGFHEALTGEATLPTELGPTEGRRLVLRLRDAGRPSQACDTEHPLSGCATVDWSDDESRPNVPPGGVFDNRLELGGQTFFLSESGALAGAPDQFRPG